MAAAQATATSDQTLTNNDSARYTSACPRGPVAPASNLTGSALQNAQAQYTLCQNLQQQWDKDQAVSSQAQAQVPLAEAQAQQAINSAQATVNTAQAAVNTARVPGDTADLSDGRRRPGPGPGQPESSAGPAGPVPASPQASQPNRTRGRSRRGSVRGGRGVSRPRWCTYVRGATGPLCQSTIWFPTVPVPTCRVGQQ